MAEFAKSASQYSPFSQRRTVAALALCVFVLSAGLGLVGSTDFMLVATLGILIVAGGVLVIRWPELGIIALIGSSLLLPLGIATGTYTSIGINLIVLTLVVAAWVMGSVLEKKPILPRSKATVPILAFCVVSMLSFGVGQLPWFDFAPAAPIRAQLGGLGTILASAAVFLLMAERAKDPKWLTIYVWLFLGIAGLVVIARLLGPVGNIIGPLVKRSATGSLFWTWLVALAFSQALINSKLSRWQRFLLIGLVLAAFYANLFQASRWASGWIPPAVAMLAVLGMGAPRIAIVTCAAGGLMTLANLGGITEFVMAGDNRYSLITRIEAWQILIDVIRVSPVFGLGPSNYYWYVPLFPILGYAVEFSSHNNYVDIAAQTGLLGLGCFALFAVALGRLGWNLRSRVPRGFPRAYVVGALGGLLGTLTAAMFGDWVIPFVYNVGLDGLRASLIGWMFLGGLLALEQAYASKRLEGYGGFD